MSLQRQDTSHKPKPLCTEIVSYECNFAETMNSPSCNNFWNLNILSRRFHEFSVNYQRNKTVVISFLGLNLIWGAAFINLSGKITREFGSWHYYFIISVIILLLTLL